MAFQVKKKGKLTYYTQGDAPVLSALVTEEQVDGDLRIHFAGLTGGYSAKSVLGLDELVTMDPDREIPLVFQCWEKWLRIRSSSRWHIRQNSIACVRRTRARIATGGRLIVPTTDCRADSPCTSSTFRTELLRTSFTASVCCSAAIEIQRESWLRQNHSAKSCLHLRSSC
jgi:hypothetical protein